MCGIVGIRKAFPSRNTVQDRGIVIGMRDRLIHRGPDDAGAWNDELCFLGHRRLAIIDLSAAGRQPMSNEEGTVWLTYNGEIYNHTAIRLELERRGHRYRSQTDSETIIHAYEEWGMKAFDRFNGMWSAVLWDRRERARPVMHLIRDRVGVKPLYFTRTPRGDWLFASEIKALLVHPDTTAQMDHTALWHYLTFIVAPAPLTMFRNIFKIPAGWRIIIDHNNDAKAEQWWDSVPTKDNMIDTAIISEEECGAEFLNRFRGSLQKRTRSDVPVGVLLSGGFDSSLTVALMSDLMDQRVNTFSIGYDGCELQNEFQYARRIANRYGTRHHEIRINNRDAIDFLTTLVEMQDEPIADNVCIPLFFLAKFVKEQGTTVVQIGEGADENWLGYWWCEYYRNKYETVYRPVRNRRRRNWFWRQLLGRTCREGAVLAEDQDIVDRAEKGQELFWGGATCWWGQLRNRLIPQHQRFRESVDCPVEGLLPAGHDSLDSHEIVRHYLAPLEGKLPEPAVMYQLPYLELKIRLAEHLLMRVDKCTMAHAVEARVPFLDYELVEFAQRVPAEYKLHNGIGKYLLKKTARPYLDDDMIWRTKQGFGAPMEEWFRDKEFNHRCRSAYERSVFCREGYFDNQFVREMFDKQQSGTSWSFHLWTIMNVVFWHEKWIN